MSTESLMDNLWLGAHVLAAGTDWVYNIALVLNLSNLRRQSTE